MESGKRRMRRIYKVLLGVLAMLCVGGLAENSIAFSAKSAERNSGMLSLVTSIADSSAKTTHDQLSTFYYENVLGTSFDMKVVSKSEAQADRAKSAALAEIDRETK